MQLSETISNQLFGLIEPLAEDSGLELGDYEIPIWKLSTKADWMGHLFKHAINSPLFESLAYLNYLGPSSAGTFSSESVSNILAGRVEPEAFQGKIVVVGFNARSLDKKLTPFGVMAGMEVQATAIHNLIHQNFLERNSNLIVFLCLMTDSFIQPGQIDMPGWADSQRIKTMTYR